MNYFAANVFISPRNLSHGGAVARYIRETEGRDAIFARDSTHKQLLVRLGPLLFSHLVSRIPLESFAPAKSCHVFSSPRNVKKKKNSAIVGPQPSRVNTRSFYLLRCLTFYPRCIFHSEWQMRRWRRGQRMRGVELIRSKKFIRCNVEEELQL